MKNSFLVWIHSEYARIYLIMNSSALLSLFPLLFQPSETITKICMSLLYTMCIYSYINRHLKKKIQWKFYDKMYLIGLLLVYLLSSCIHLAGMTHMEFLPLMLISVYCAFGIVIYSMILYRTILLEN